jgi:dihydrofolate synthase/folylpolyglutamate synthase
VVIAENTPEAIASLQNKVRECDALVTWVKSATKTATGATYQGFEYSLPLLGQHQLMNSAVAIAVIHSLRNQGWQISDDAISLGMANTTWAGRLQWIDFELNGSSCKILIDGAHNVAAAEYLRQFVDESFPNQRIRWVIGILNTKDQSGILKALLHPDDLLFVVPVPNSATTAPEDLKAIAMTIIKTEPQYFDSLELGLVAAFDDMRSDDVVILCGSLYLVGEFLSSAIIA